MASRINLSEVQNLPDILSTENFRLNIGAIPNGNGDSTSLSIKCQSASIPGRQSEAYEVSLGGFIRTFRGRTRTTNQMQVSFVEDVTLDTLNQLRSWLQAIGGTSSGTAIGDTSAYSVSAELSIFDQAGNEIDVIKYTNFYIVDVQDIGLEVSGTAAMMVQAVFRHDNVEYSNTQSL